MIVRKLKRDFRKGSSSSPYDENLEIAVNDQHLKIYKKLFEQAGAPYKVSESNGYFNIVWRLQYAEKVDQIVEDAGFKLYATLKNK